jgi:hypothetical protein
MPYPNDHVHDRADARAADRNGRDDRTATHALFTPLDVDGIACGDPIAVTCRTRVTSRWLGGKDPARRGILVVVTVDDVAQGAPLAAHDRFMVETWRWVEGDPGRKRGWYHDVEYAVAVDGVVIAPGWVEVEGYAQLVNGLLSAGHEGAEAPPFLTESAAR